MTTRSRACRRSKGCGVYRSADPVEVKWRPDGVRHRAACSLLAREVSSEHHHGAFCDGGRRHCILSLEFCAPTDADPKAHRQELEISYAAPP